MSISDNGVISGTPTEAGLFDNIILNVEDTGSPQDTAQTTLTLKVYITGDGNGSNGGTEPTVSDVTWIEDVMLSIYPPTAGCDADLDGSISVLDVTRTEDIILGIP
jgi:hypothetical protein